MSVRLLQGDALTMLATLPDASVHLVMTSPPYLGLRSYLPAGHPDKAKEIGSEASPAEFIAALVDVFREVRRVLRDDGVCVVNLGDGYSVGVGLSRGKPYKRHSAMKAGLWAGTAKEKRDLGNDGRVYDGSGMKPKDLLGIPFAVAFALRDDGWYWRSCLPWVRRSVMPESVTDRPGSAVEYVHIFTKQPKYYWDSEAVRRVGAIPAGTLAAKGSATRHAEDGVNARPAEYAEYSGTRNFRNSDLFFDSLEPPFGLICDTDGEPLALDVNPEPLALPHYAAYPSKLVVPFVKAGTSERGCCSSCGAPWARHLEKDTRPGSTSYRNDANGKRANGNHDRNDESEARFHTVTQTLGWLPSCRCEAGDPVPCTVLDPFGGVGTTGLVADRLGRNAVLIELNADYCEMSTKRLTKDGGLFADVAAQ